MPSHSKHAYTDAPERPRVFDGKPLRRSEHQLRADVARTRAEMRESAAWQTSLAKLRELSLCQGYIRPTSSERGWGFQNSATMPGDPASSPAAQADDIAQQLREAFAFVHPMDDLPSRMTPAQRAAIQWQCDQPAQPGLITRLREARFSALAKCARALEGWNAALGEHSPPWIRDCVPPRPHYALLDCCIEASGLPDAGLVEDLVVGAPCVGTGQRALCAHTAFPKPVGGGGLQPVCSRCAIGPSVTDACDGNPDLVQARWPPQPFAARAAQTPQLCGARTTPKRRATTRR